MMRFYFLSHSGFLVEMESCFLLFDYFQGPLPDLTGQKPIFVFVSHGHHDHFNPEIFRLPVHYGWDRVRFVLHAGIRRTKEESIHSAQITRLSPYESCLLQPGSIQVEPLRSNDEGLAYLLQLDGHVIYHAGDLQWWDWPGEPDADNQYYRESYQKEIARIEGRRIDLAMLVLDPRQEQSAYFGIDWFLSHTNTRYAVPMHSFGQFEINQAYAVHFIEEQRAGHIPPETQYLELRREGQFFDL